MPNQNFLAANRKRHGLTLEELAALVGTSKSMIFVIERGWRDPRLSLALALELTLGVPVADLFPALQASVENQVMLAGAKLDEKLRHRDDEASLAKLRLIESIAKRARGAGPA